MTIGTSSGEYYESKIDMLVAHSMALEATEKPVEAIPETPLGRGSGANQEKRFAGMDDVLTDKQIDTFKWNSPVYGTKDPRIWEGPFDEIHKEWTDDLRKPQEQVDKEFEDDKKRWNDWAKESEHATPMGPEHVPPRAGQFRIWKHKPAIQEYIKNLPEDIDVFDLQDGTVVFKRKSALTS